MPAAPPNLIYVLVARELSINKIFTFTHEDCVCWYLRNKNTKFVFTQTHFCDGRIP